MPRITTIQARKGTATDWSTQNPVLASGELGYDLTNKLLKLGDGLSNWASLGSINLSSSNITDFNSSVSGILPVKNIAAGDNINISSSGGTYTINASNTIARGTIVSAGNVLSSNIPGGYVVGALDIFQNGVKLIENIDFSATNGTSIVFSSPFPSGSTIEYLKNYTTTNLASFGLGTAATSAISDFLPSTFTNSSLTYSATTNLDMSSLAGGYRTLSLTGNVTFTTSNRASGRQVTIRLICDGTTRTFTFPSGWVFIGNKPSSIIASKTAILSLSFFGTNDSDCVAAYGVQT